MTWKAPSTGSYPVDVRARSNEVAIARTLYAAGDRLPRECLHDAVAQPEDERCQASGQHEKDEQQPGARRHQADVGAEGVRDAPDPQRAEDDAGDRGDAAEDRHGDEIERLLGTEAGGIEAH